VVKRIGGKDVEDRGEWEIGETARGLRVRV